jgi:hypothetical protein
MSPDFKSETLFILSQCYSVGREEMKYMKSHLFYSFKWLFAGLSSALTPRSNVQTQLPFKFFLVNYIHK